MVYNNSMVIRMSESRGHGHLEDKRQGTEDRNQDIKRRLMGRSEEGSEIRNTILSVIAYLSYLMAFESIRWKTNHDV